MNVLDTILAPKNEHRWDRGVRVIGGLALTTYALAYQAPWGLLGLIFVVTGLVGRCPIYRILGVSTCAECDA